MLADIRSAPIQRFEVRCQFRVGLIIVFSVIGIVRWRASPRWRRDSPPRSTPGALDLSTAPGQCRARERPPLSLTRTHQGTTSSSNTRARARSAVFDVRGNTNTWVERGGHDRAAAPAGSCWPAAALRSSPLLEEYLSGSLCAGERAQVMYHRPHWPGALRHRTLTVRRRRVLMLRITGPTFAQRRKLRASAL